MNHPNPIIILGGRSLVTPYLIERLSAANLTADIVSRRDLDVPQRFKSISLDLTQARTWQAPEHSIVISLLPLEILAQNLTHFSRAQSIIALGYTSRFSKAGSNDPIERRLAENMEMAENILKPWCLRNRKVFTLLRPTLVYDGLSDPNIARMARIIRRTGTLPVASPGMGLRQPIHADDVAKAIMGALGNANAYNKSLNIAGGEVLTYRHMVETVFRALGVTPRFLMLPTKWLQRGFQLATKCGLLREQAFSFGMFKRMNEDLVYDTQEGLQILGYAPRGFMPELKAS